MMVGAMWLTVIGPAVQSGDTMLGVLPRHDAFDGEAWMTPLWQLSLFCMAVVLFFAGPGTMSLDRLLLGRPPQPAPPKPAQVPAARSRTGRTAAIALCPGIAKRRTCAANMRTMISWSSLRWMSGTTQSGAG